jgi:hypothetical protein
LSWDAYQRVVLRELGLEVYALPHTSAAASIEIAQPAARDADMLARAAKAAGLQPQALLAQLDLHTILPTLRGNAAAKRALWPRLRTLRCAAR